MIRFESWSVVSATKKNLGVKLIFSKCLGVLKIIYLNINVIYIYIDSCTTFSISSFFSF